MLYSSILRIGLALCLAGLGACNSGGGAPSSPAPQGASPSLSGQFIDAPVSGLSYVAGSDSTLQLTDALGFFFYRAGERVLFSLGGIELGSAPGAPVITPLNAVDGNARAALNMTRFLLTLDEDGNPANGLQLTGGVRSAATQHTQAVSAFDVEPSTFASTAVADFARHGNGDGERRLRSESDAIAEQQCSAADLEDGHYDGDCERGLPRVDAGPDITSDEGLDVVFNASALASDSRSIQSLRWRQSRGPIATINGAIDQNHLRITAPQVDEDVTLEFVLEAVDSGGLTGTDSVTVLVRDVAQNRVPTVNAGPDQNVTAGETVVLRASATDTDGTIVASAWRAQSQSPAVRLEEIDELSVRFVAPNVPDTTTLVFEFSATDNDNARAVDTLSVRVAPAPSNEAPSIHSAYADPGVASAGELVDLLSSASDADGDPLSFRWRQLEPAEPQLVISNAQMALAETDMPVLDNDTLFEIEVDVSDGAKSIRQTVQLQGVPPSGGNPSAVACLSDPTQAGCPLWTFRDMLAPQDFANCFPNPLSPNCPLAVIAEADPGVLACLTLRTDGACTGIAENLFDPSYLTERIPPDRPATSCNPQFDAATYEHYIGAWHEHTAYSDGTWNQRPIDMMEQAKARGLDWAASSEHSDTLDPGNPAALPRDCQLEPQIDGTGLHPECFVGDRQEPANNIRKWEAIQEMADAVSDESFTALRGFEWTSDRFGHINVFFSNYVINAKTEAGYAVSMTRFWQWFNYPAAFGGGDDAILSFNHPGREDLIEGFLHDDVQGNFEEYIAELPLDLHDPAYTFNDFRYVPAADYRAIALEVFGKGSEYDSGGKGGSWLSYALDKGWHLGPMGSEDHHGTDWGAESLPKTVVIARSRKPSDLKEALLARRFYAVAQHYNDVRVDYHVDGQPMGSRIRAPQGSQLNFSVSISRGGVPFPARVEVVTKGNTVAQSLNGTDVTGSVIVDSEESYYFLRIFDPATDRPIAFAAPVWLLPGDSPLPGCPVDGGVPK